MQRRGRDGRVHESHGAPGLLGVEGVHPEELKPQQAWYGGFNGYGSNSVPAGMIARVHACVHSLAPPFRNRCGR